MITFEDATRLVLGMNQPLSSERLPLVDAVGRFLAGPLIAAHDSPRFDQSAVDGYGVRTDNVPGRLHLAGYSEAGDPFMEPMEQGRCIRVLTGAAVLPDVEGIALQEDCRLEGDSVFVERSVRKGDHIRRQGEEYLKGELLLGQGTLVTPSVVGLAAAQGSTWLEVGTAPRVEILCTGKELVAPGAPLGQSTLYASNAATLLAATRALGLAAEAKLLPDDPWVIKSAMEAAFEKADLVITTGGVSVGDRDYVRNCAIDLGTEEVFWRVAMKPGKPVFFGLRKGKPLLGLPGNPVAAMVAFQVFVRPTILRLMGAANPSVPVFPVRLCTPLRKRAGRTEFVRVRFEGRAEGLCALPTKGQGSHMIGGTALAEGLLHLPPEVEQLAEGETAQASFLRWGLL
ncbi:molybdopterin molybdotransferase MoeA [soil metagenome]